MLPVPPDGLIEHIDVEDGRFVLIGDVTDEQREEFERWRSDVEETESEELVVEGK